MPNFEKKASNSPSRSTSCTSLDRLDRRHALKKALAQRILVMDGAMGTQIQGRHLKTADFGGAEHEGCNEILTLTRPEIISSIHEAYLSAGADIIETNTFGGTPLVLSEFGLGDRAGEINRKAAELAVEAARLHSTPERPRFVAGSIGPTTRAISVTGGIRFEELVEAFYVQSEALFKGGVDYFLIETCQDTRNIKAALAALDRLSGETGLRLPVAVSVTVEAGGTMLAGQGIDALIASLAHHDLLHLGLNCASGPEGMREHVRSLARRSPFPVSCKPNAGLPDENGEYLKTPVSLSDTLSRFAADGWLNLVGGCCGTTPDHVAAIARAVQGVAPRAPRLTESSRTSYLSGIDLLEVTEEARPVLVGERTNVIGSRKFKDLIAGEKFEEAAEVAQAQVKAGAQIVDICLSNPDRDELRDMTDFLEASARRLRVPLMLDSMDDRVIAKALTYCQGKAIINSVNLENGEDRFEKVIPLARRFGAALVVGTIDDDPTQGMAITRARKLEVADRAYRLLTEKYGFPPQDIYWDPLTFPCGTGDRQYRGSAVETIEGLRLIKARYPETKSVLGISNVSFGLPPAGREVLNSVFLYHCTMAGLDLAIVNSQKLVRYPIIPENERTLAEDLLFNRGDDPIQGFVSFFRELRHAAQASAPDRQRLPLGERLARYVIEGSKDGLGSDLEEALQSLTPLEIINGPLMTGMGEVGRLFNRNQLIVAEVLQSAEVMKAAVDRLKPHLKHGESGIRETRGRILIATVKGDVHDIGKNLVYMILTNNGYEVIDLGIKVSSDRIITAVREHSPEVIGLSGLLVKSAHQMVTTAQDLAQAGIRIPLLLGGAALSRNFVDRFVAPAYGGPAIYAPDAMKSLELLQNLLDPEKMASSRANGQELAGKPAAEPSPATNTLRPGVRSATVPVLTSLPRVPDFTRHLLTNTPIRRIWAYLNQRMLYGRHLGLKESASSERTREIRAQVETIKNEYRDTEALRPSAVYRFYRAASRGNELLLFEPGADGESRAGDRPAAIFRFDRGPEADGGLCLSDYVTPLPEDVRARVEDSVALLAASVGRGLRELTLRLRDEGDYLKTHVLQALALESAEAYAELIHEMIREAWGFPDPAGMTMNDRFQAKYRGKRYSFGYPACPRLEDQKELFRLLAPEEIGVRLTEGYMMDPEASVSAIVFHHPNASYFSTGVTHGHQRV